MDLLKDLTPTPQPLPGKPAMTHLTRPQKAAVLVRLLLSHEVSPGLDKLTPMQQGRLARAMSGLGQIDRTMLAEIVTEFTEQLESLGVSMPHGMHAALELLDPYISPLARDGLNAEAEIGDGTDPWLRLAAMEPERLRPLLDSESAEICAILLSKLNVAKAAKLLSDVPPDRARIIAHAVSLTDTVRPETIRKIGEQLHTQVVAAPKRAFKNDPVNRIGSILNATHTAAREAVLDGLEQADADFAAAVRKAIFTFPHIPARVDPADVPRIVGAVEDRTISIALAAGFEKAPMAAEFLLANMSKRMAEQLRASAEALGTPKPEPGEAAMQAVIAAIRTMEEAGQLRLRTEDD